MTTPSISLQQCQPRSGCPIPVQDSLGELTGSPVPLAVPAPLQAEDDVSSTGPVRINSAWIRDGRVVPDAAWESCSTRIKASARARNTVLAGANGQRNRPRRRPALAGNLRNSAGGSGR